MTEAAEGKVSPWLLFDFDHFNNFLPKICLLSFYMKFCGALYVCFAHRPSDVVQSGV